MRAPTWDLDSVMTGGVRGEAFTAALAAFKRDGDAAIARSESLDGLGDDAAALLLDLQDLGNRGRQLNAFAGCHASANTKDTAARLATNAVMEVFLAMDRAWLALSWTVADADADAREAWLSREDIAPHRSGIEHMVEGKKLELDRPLQELRSQLEREALHGWGSLYTAMSGELTATLTLPGEEPKQVGIAAIAPYRNHPDEAIRKAAFEAEGAAWATLSTPCAMALTHITGERQAMLDRVGADHLAPTLFRNRIERESLEALLAAAEAARPRLEQYLARKAKLIGKDKLDFWDLHAPLVAGEGASVPWDQATAMITTAFDRFASPIGDFAKRALDKRWVEAERRDGKAQGGYCTRLPLSGESRIFMTYGDTLDNALTLAHELGHAYHNSVLFRADSPQKHRITSALAETASTFCEAILRDHAIQVAEDETQRIAMLDQQLQDAAVFMMNIPMRYAFECRLYELRREGAFDADVLCDEMERIQREHFGDILGTPDRWYWASKLHYYISHFGFYNWPYLFGYLFSGAVYAHGKAAGEGFIDTYDALLAATGWRDTESIAMEFLGGDVRTQAFWDAAVDEALAPLDDFLALTA